jgi:4a-hydroxytetrahydrobiopterin dehydratase
LAAINEYGAIAEECGHHPDLAIRKFREVEIRVWTHSAGGLTRNDFILAAKLDRVPVNYSPKFLKENPHLEAGVKSV